MANDYDPTQTRQWTPKQPQQQRWSVELTLSMTAQTLDEAMSKAAAASLILEQAGYGVYLGEDYQDDQGTSR